MSDAGGNAASGKHEDDQAKKLAEGLAKAQAAGWTNPIPMNNETVGSGAVPENKEIDEAPWLCNAAVYEFDDEYGDVGPRNEELEQLLFFGENLMKVGNKVNALDFEVNVFGPKKVSPFRSVCISSAWMCIG